ncbi:hypothetical protein D3C85_1425510 [compost metagenome]
MSLQIKAEAAFGLNAAQLGLNDSNGVVDLFVFLTDDGEGLDLPADILIDQEAQVLGHKVTVIHSYVIIMSQ